MKIYIKIWLLLGTLIFTGCVDQDFIGLKSLKGNSVGFSFDGVHSRETAMAIYSRGPRSAKGAIQSIAVRDVVHNDSHEGFYRDAAYQRVAYIHLIFTKPGENALLRQVVVDWRDGARFFQAGIFDHQAVKKHYNYVASQLTRKYGKRKGKGLWKANESTTIKLKKTVVGVKLTFTDNGSSHKKSQKNTPTASSKYNLNDILSTSNKNNLNNILSTAMQLGSILKR